MVLGLWLGGRWTKSSGVYFPIEREQGEGRERRGVDLRSSNGWEAGRVQRPQWRERLGVLAAKGIDQILRKIRARACCCAEGLGSPAGYLVVRLVPDASEFKGRMF